MITSSLRVTKHTHRHTNGMSKTSLRAWSRANRKYHFLSFRKCQRSAVTWIFPPSEKCMCTRVNLGDDQKDKTNQDVQKRESRLVVEKKGEQKTQ